MLDEEESTNPDSCRDIPIQLACVASNSGEALDYLLNDDMPKSVMVSQGDHGELLKRLGCNSIDILGIPRTLP